MSPDPGNAGAALGDPQTWNGYAYVRNSPMHMVDPSGMDTMVPSWATTVDGGAPDPLGTDSAVICSDINCSSFYFTATASATAGRSGQIPGGNVNFSSYFGNSGLSFGGGYRRSSEGLPGGLPARDRQCLLALAEIKRSIRAIAGHCIPIFLPKLAGPSQGALSER
jgi:hypothetical protein